MRALADEEIAALGAQGWFSRPDFLGEALARQVRGAAEAVSLRRAGVRRAAALDEAVRTDSLAWIDRATTAEAFQAAMGCFERLMAELNERAWLGLRTFDLQLARYQPGGRYVRHRDAFPGDDNRRVTAIVYLNDGWRPADGGQLRLHLSTSVELEPRLDRLVVFLSAEVEHEVLPAQAERWALTAWYSAR